MSAVNTDVADVSGGRVGAPLPAHPGATLVGRIAKVTSGLASLALLAMAFHVIIDVALRWIGEPIGGTLEITSFVWMPLVVFLALPGAYLAGEQLRATILVDHLPGRWRGVADTASSFVFFLFAVIVGFFLWTKGIHSITLGETAVSSGVPVPIWPTRIAAAVGFTLLAVMAAVDVAAPVRHSSASKAVAHSAVESTDIDVLEGAVAEPTQSTPSKFAKLLAIGILLVSIALGFAIVGLDLSRPAIGGLVVAMIVVLLVGGVHVAVSIVLPSVLGVLALATPNALGSMLEDLPYLAVAGWQYSVIPLFILMGMALWRSGIAANTFRTARYWLGWMPGGLAVGTVVTGGGLAAASGSTIGIAYSLGRGGLPEMLKAKYSSGIAIGAVSVAGIIGQIIPPSIIAVIYAGIVQTSIGEQLLAGVVPGILLIVAYSVMLIVLGITKPKIAPRSVIADATWPARFKSLWGAMPLVAVIGIVVGGMLSGVFTATEGGAVGALVALLVGLMALGKRSKESRTRWSFLYESAVGAVHAAAGVFTLLIAVFFLTKVLALSRLPQMMATWIADLGLSATVFLFLLIPFYLLLGCFLDTMSMLLVTVPVLLPTVIALQIDLVWFGVFVIILAEMALITPPIGILIFIVHRLAQESVPNGHQITLGSAFKGVGYYLVPTLVVVVLLVFAPQIISWFPGAGGPGN